MSFLKRCVAAVMAATTLGLMTQGVASAVVSGHHPGGADLVTFGDSFTANVGTYTTLEGRYNAGPFPVKCGTDSRNWPHQLADKNKWTLSDYSCNGTNLGTLQAYQAYAISVGDLGKNTKRVVISYGGLDPFLTTANLTTGFSGAVLDVDPFAAEMRIFFDAVKKAAPDAKIYWMGYPALSDEDGICLFNPIPNKPLKLVQPLSYEFERGWAKTQRTISERNGVTFVDVNAQTKDAGTCRDDATKNVSGIVDNARSNMAFHPTEKGMDVISQVAIANIK